MTAFGALWGMNFEVMPELSLKYGYLFSLILIAVSTALVYWFRHDFEVHSPQGAESRHRRKDRRENRQRFKDFIASVGCHHFFGMEQIIDFIELIHKRRHELLVIRSLILSMKKVAMGLKETFLSKSFDEIEQRRTFYEIDRGMSLIKEYANEINYLLHSEEVVTSHRRFKC